MSKIYLIIAVIAAVAEQILTFKLFYRNIGEYLYAWCRVANKQRAIDARNQWLYGRKDGSDESPLCIFEHEEEDGDEGVFDPIVKLLFFSFSGIMTAIAVYHWMPKFF